MPHAAFYVVQHTKSKSCAAAGCFNAARSILCSATSTDKMRNNNNLVSMPHAALYVVQL